MHAAKLSRSPRLRRVGLVLSDGREHSTLEIIQSAQVCAVNSIVAELRANGLDIRCQRRGGVWFYRLVSASVCKRFQWDCGADAVRSGRYSFRKGHWPGVDRTSPARVAAPPPFFNGELP
jgi:hypothetical protein